MQRVWSFSGRNCPYNSTLLVCVWTPRRPSGKTHKNWQGFLRTVKSGAPFWTLTFLTVRNLLQWEDVRVVLEWLEKSNTILPHFVTSWDVSWCFSSRDSLRQTSQGHWEGISTPFVERGAGGEEIWTLVLGTLLNRYWGHLTLQRRPSCKGPKDTRPTHFPGSLWGSTDIGTEGSVLKAEFSKGLCCLH